MFGTRTIDVAARKGEAELRRTAEGLAGAMPRLAADARRASSGVMAGVHGRRRSGQGETFWQFRPFVSGEAASRVDWRRSARDGTLYVREREWEAAQAVWLFVDRSASMDYRSGFAPVSKEERAIVLGLAAADMLVRGGERVGLMNTSPAIASRRIVDRLADVMVSVPDFGKSWPTEAVAPRSEVIMISDFIAPLKDIEASLKTIAGRGAKGVLLMVSDPAEESFPFQGQTEFQDPEDGFRLRSGAAEELVSTYKLRLEAHREALRRIASSLGWNMVAHVTTSPASDALMRVSMALSGEGR